MKERIKQIIENENLSYSKFADIIDIQPSGISHIVNGRNKPSLEVVQKILESFDYINSDWLLFGKGAMKKYKNNPNEKNLFSDLDIKTTDIKKIKEESEKNNSISDEIIEDSTVKEILEHSTEVKINLKNIDRIIILYSDKSFIDYHPE